MSITISNQKVLDFFQRNPSIDPNILFANIIDFYEYAINTLSNGNSNQLLSYIIDNSNKIDNIKSEMSSTFHHVKDLVSKLNSDLSTNIISKLFDLRNSYIEDVKSVVFQHNTDNLEKFKEISHLHQQHILDTTHKIVSDLGLQLSDRQSNEINNSMVVFQRHVSEELKSIFASNVSPQEQLNTFSQSLQQKIQDLHVSLQQPLMSIISTSEERFNHNINQLNVISQHAQHIENIQSQLHSLLNKFNNSSQKGRLSENLLHSVLTKAFPSAEVYDNTSDPHSCDFRLKRLNKHDILIENKTYSRNVDKDEVSKFLEDIDKHDCCGILLSQDSGICNKDNWQIDIHNGNVVIFIHNVNYDPETLQLAVQIIDNLFQKLIDTAIHEGTLGISQETLVSLNNELQIFLKQRDNLVTFIRNFQKDATNKLKELQLPNFQSFLASHFSSPDVPKMFSCKFCDFSGDSKHSVSGHLRSCKSNPKNQKPT